MKRCDSCVRRILAVHGRWHGPRGGGGARAVRRLKSRVKMMSVEELMLEECADSLGPLCVVTTYIPSV
jgi:hypothetical protein